MSSQGRVSVCYDLSQRVDYAAESFKPGFRPCVTARYIKKFLIRGGVVMEDSAYSLFDQSVEALKLDFTSQELAHMASENNYSPEQIKAIIEVFQALQERKQETIISTLLKLSRLPMKAPKTFENYDFTRIFGKDAEEVKNLSSLSEVHAGMNLALIGPPGVGNYAKQLIM